MKKTLIRISSILGAIACAIAVLFVPFSHKIEPKNILSASANDGLNYTEFVGADVFLPVTVSQTQNTSTIITTNYFPVSMSFYETGFRIFVGSDNSLSSSIQPYTAGTKTLYVGSTGMYLHFETVVDSSAFNYATITFVEIGGYVYNGAVYNSLRYFDGNGNRVCVNAIARSTSFTPLDVRQYLFGSSLSGDESYRVGYAGGYAKGNADGYAQGESIGYSNGYDNGVTVGYNNGYNEGLQHGGDYTFTSLVSSFIDVPVQTFIGLFNFELLGVNLAGFFTGLMTLAFIITIVRLLKG